MSQLDLAGTHELTYEEFLATTIQMHKLECEDNLHQAFHDFDPDGDGEITEEELAVKLVQLGIKASKAEIHAMIEEVDEDHNGTIDYHEFVTLMVGRLHGHESDYEEVHDKHFHPEVRGSLQLPRSAMRK